MARFPMPLFLRRRPETFPCHAVINSEGYVVGVIQDASRHVVGPPWEWSINGEIVGHLVAANGRAATLSEAKTALARNWRRWLDLCGLPEDHRPQYGRHYEPPPISRTATL